METTKRAVIAGSSGLLGTALAQQLQAHGWRLTKLVRHRPTASDQVQWDPAHGELDPQVLAEAEAVICLSGAPLVHWPWTRSYQRQLVTSRLAPVQTLVNALRTLPAKQRPHTLLTASAVGYYGDRGEEILHEDSGGANDFLAGLCRTWERLAQSAPVACHTQIRTGIVIGEGGFIQALQPLARHGLLGPVGSGQQWLSPISLTDHARATEFALTHHLTGAVNLVGPEQYRNAEVMTMLARNAGHRPAPRVPAPLVRIGLGRLAQVVLTSQRAVPTRLQAAGFTYQHPTLEAQIAQVNRD